MKKIAIISTGILPIPAVNGGAVETLTTNLLEENEKKKKFYFDVYTCYDKKLSEKRYQKTTIIPVQPGKMLTLFCKIFNRLSHYIRAGKIISSYNACLYLKNSWYKYDYILVENSMRTYKILYLKKACRKKLIYHMHNDLESGNQDKSVSRTRLIGKSAKLFLTCSDYLKNKVKGVYPSENIYVLNNCIDIEQFSDKNISSRERLREKYHIKREDTVIMYSGRLSEEKGVKELLLAFSQLKEIDNVKLLLVGSAWFPDIMETPYMSKLKLIMEKMQERVVVTGFIDAGKMPEYYALCDFVVIPSICEEAFGLVALEAMAMKKPLIITRSGGLTEVIDKNCAIVVEKDEKLIENLYESMKILIINTALRKTMGEAGYIRILENKRFHINNYYDNFCKYIELI